MPQDDPGYQFLDKKRAQGKPYYVYMTAGANKFLRIYYGRVKEYLATLPESNKSKLISFFRPALVVMVLFWCLLFQPV